MFYRFAFAALPREILYLQDSMNDDHMQPSAKSPRLQSTRVPVKHLAHPHSSIQPCVSPKHSMFTNTDNGFKMSIFLRGSRVPEKSQIDSIEFFSNTGPDPLKITKLPSQHSMLGHHRPASETPFKWRFAGGPMMALF